MQNPSVLAAHRDSKNDSIFGARREIQRRTTPCTELHGRYRIPKQLARNAKKPEENLWLCSTGFKKLTERTGTELLGVFSMFRGSSRGAYTIHSI
jgi:hypothetical protein